jgi:hypothetical protein
MDMTKLLEEIVEDVRALPEHEQDRIAGALLKLLHYLQDDQLLA